MGGTGAADAFEVASRLGARSLVSERSGIRTQREYSEVPPVLLDRHRLLQSLVNLLNNARHAMMESGREDLPRLFSHGFTTKKEGHGFGLHASALAAEEMNGRLSCDSGGRDQGATFIIELPIHGQEART